MLPVSSGNSRLGAGDARPRAGVPREVFLLRCVCSPADQGRSLWDARRGGPLQIALRDGRGDAPVAVAAGARLSPGAALRRPVVSALGVPSSSLEYAAASDAPREPRSAATVDARLAGGLVLAAQGFLF